MLLRLFLLFQLMHNMHGATTKIVDAQQARLYNSYKNTKCKLRRTNAAIWFNKTCKTKQV